MNRSAVVVVYTIFVAIGLLLIAMGQLTQALLPEIGLMAFRLTKAGTYPNDYAPNLWGYYAIAVIFIAIGAWGVRKF